MSSRLFSAEGPPLAESLVQLKPEVLHSRCALAIFPTSIDVAGVEWLFEVNHSLPAFD